MTTLEMTSLRFDRDRLDKGDTGSAFCLRTTPYLLIVFVVLTHTLVSCSSETPSMAAPEQTVCRPEAARKLLARPTDEEIKFLTKARVVRRVAPHDVVTQDFREDRVTVVNDSTGRVISARCG